MGLEDSEERLNCNGIWCCLEGEGGARKAQRQRSWIPVLSGIAIGPLTSLGSQPSWIAEMSTSCQRSGAHRELGLWCHCQ